MLSLAGAPPRGNKIPPQRTFRDFRPFYRPRCGQAAQNPGGRSPEGFSWPAVPTAPAGVAQRNFHGLRCQPPRRTKCRGIFPACGANRPSSLFFPALSRPAGGGGDQSGEGPVGLGLVPVSHRGHVVPALEHPPVGHPDLLQSHPQVLGEADGI